MSVTGLMQIVFLGSALTLLYVYLGYPLIVGLAAGALRRFTRPVVGSDDVLPTVSLVIAAHNEERVIREKLENCLSLDYPRNRLEILVAADGCADRTNEIVAEFAGAGVRLSATFPRRGKIRVLNEAIPSASGEIVVLSDANTMYAPVALRTLVRHFADPLVGGVTGDVRLQNDSVSFGASEGLYYRYERFLMQHESALGSLVGVDGAMYAIRKRLFSPPSGNIILDDFVISMNVARHGYRLVYDPAAVAFEDATPELLQEFKRKIRIVAGGFQALLQREGLPRLAQGRLWFAYVSHKLLRWLTPFALLACLVSTVALMPQRPIFASLVAAQAAFYALAIAGTYNRRLLSSRLVNVPNYFCMVQTAAFFGFWKGVFGLQPVMWEQAKRRQRG